MSIESCKVLNLLRPYLSKNLEVKTALIPNAVSSITAATDSSGNFQCINYNILPGYTSTSRLGNVISLIAIEFTWNILATVLAPLVSPFYSSFGLVYDSHTNGAFPTGLPSFPYYFQRQGCHYHYIYDLTRYIYLYEIFTSYNSQFSPFPQLDNTTIDSYGGSGRATIDLMGLQTVYKGSAGAITDIASGSLLITLATEDNPVTFEYSGIIYYTDF